MLQYYKFDTHEDNPNFNFIEKLKELFSIIDKAEMAKFISKPKVYDLYPLRNVLEDSNKGTNRFNMEEMADAGEAYGELLDLILKDLSLSRKEEFLLDAVALPLEKHFT